MAEEPREPADAVEGPSPESSPQAALLTAPNLLTVARLVLLPVILWGMSRGHAWLAVLAMAVAVGTDLVDGRIARKMGIASEFGRNLDSVIDFVFLYSLFIGLWASRHMPTYQFAFIWLAMFTILTSQLAGGLGSEGVVKTTFGKPTGALQYLFLLLAILGLVIAAPWYGLVRLIVFWVLAIVVILNVVECAGKLQLSS